MVIQIIPAGERKKSFLESLAEGTGEGIKQALAMHQKEAAEQRAFERQNKLRMMQNLESDERAHQQRKQLQDSFQGLEELYSNPELSEQQKLIGAYRQLSSNPDLAKQLTGQLGQLSEKQGEEDFLSRLMGRGQDQLTPPKNLERNLSENEFEEGPSRRSSGYDPSSWNDKQIDQLRAMRSKSPRAQTLVNLAQQEYDRRQESKKARTKYQEGVAPLQSALETLDQMVSIGKKGNLGIGSGYKGIISPKTRKDRAEYERLGKSLIQYSSNIPIRNKQEFETLAHDLYDPSISDASREGILDAMRRIIQSSMQQYEKPEEEGMQARQPRQPSKQERPPLTSFIR